LSRESGRRIVKKGATKDAGSDLSLLIDGRKFRPEFIWHRGMASYGGRSVLNRF
jgi:hypothetical protein